MQIVGGYRSQWPAVLLLAASMLTCATSGSAEDCCDANCLFALKFLDDLGRIGRPGPHRNPYEERIETERRDFTQSTKTVGRGVVQIESGYSYFYKDADEEIEQLHAAPEMLLRLGLSDDIEFRLRFNYGWLIIDEVEDLDGSQDLLWSFKLGMTDQSDLVAESALELRFSAPTGGSEFSTRRDRLRWIWAFCPATFHTGSQCHTGGDGRDASAGRACGGPAV